MDRYLIRLNGSPFFTMTVRRDRPGTGSPQELAREVAMGGLPGGVVAVEPAPKEG